MTSYNLKSTNLFKPIKVGNLELLNRVVLAPLTRNRTFDDFTLVDEAINYYDQRSRRPGSLLISEATLVSKNASGNYKPPGLFTSKHSDIWSKVITKIHENKSFIFLQIWALGAQADPIRIHEAGLQYVSASDDVYITESKKQLSEQVGVKIHGLTQNEIKQYISDYVESAKKFVEIGGDGVELHAANGYLPFQFLYNKINKRTDEYGGSIENRARFTLEIIDALIDAIGHEKVGIRLSPYFGFSEDELNPFDEETIAVYSYILSQFEKKRLQGKELAYVHVTEPKDSLKEAKEKGIYLSNEFVFSNYNGVVIRALGYGEDHVKTQRDLANHEKTLIAYGKRFISNPDLADRLENDLPLTDFERDTFYDTGEIKHGYLDYPFYGKEPEY